MPETPEERRARAARESTEKMLKTRAENAARRAEAEAEADRRAEAEADRKRRENEQ